MRHQTVDERATWYEDFVAPGVSVREIADMDVATLAAQLDELYAEWDIEDGEGPCAYPYTEDGHVNTAMLAQGILDYARESVARLDEDRVADGMACPNPACGESRVDWLRLVGFDENAVHCETCGTWYKIPEPEVG